MCKPSAYDNIRGGGLIRGKGGYGRERGREGASEGARGETKGGREEGDVRDRIERSLRGPCPVRLQRGAG